MSTSCMVNVTVEVLVKSKISKLIKARVKFSSLRSYEFILKITKLTIKRNGRTRKFKIVASEKSLNSR